VTSVNVVAGGEFLACTNDTFLSSQSYTQRLWDQTNLYEQRTGLAAGLSPPIAGFDRSSVHVGFVVYKLILRQVLRRVVRYSLFSVISQMTHFIHLPLTLYTYTRKKLRAVIDNNIVYMLRSSMRILCLTTTSY
jgi:hypothetical protein